MFSSWRYYIVVALCLLVFGAPWIAQNYPDQVSAFVSAFNDAASQVASVIFHNPRTITELQTKYATTSFVMSTHLADLGSSPVVFSTTSDQQLPVTPAKIKVLLVPGHEPGFGGTEFGSLKERNMNVELAQDISDLLQADPHFQVYITRDDSAWSSIFSTYFKDHWDEIKAWQKSSHDEMKHLIAIGSTTAPVSKVIHNAAPLNVALRLYGITKWANENTMDVVIHVHFNDFPDHRSNVPGRHAGFSIYVPVGQYANSTTTKAIANAVFKRLLIHNSVSDLPGESSGIIDEPQLIAIGANNTADAASMLIEYGYIYEPQFKTAAKREAAFKIMANDTYLGLQDFFTSDPSVTPGYF